MEITYSPIYYSTPAYFTVSAPNKSKVKYSETFSIGFARKYEEMYEEMKIKIGPKHCDDCCFNNGVFFGFCSNCIKAGMPPCRCEADRNDHVYNKYKCSFHNLKPTEPNAKVEKEVETEVDEKDVETCLDEDEMDDYSLDEHYNEDSNDQIENEKEENEEENEKEENEEENEKEENEMEIYKPIEMPFYARRALNKCNMVDSDEVLLQRYRSVEKLSLDDFQERVKGYEEEDQIEQINYAKWIEKDAKLREYNEQDKKRVESEDLHFNKYVYTYSKE